MTSSDGCLTSVKFLFIFKFIFRLAATSAAEASDICLEIYQTLSGAHIASCSLDIMDIRMLLRGQGEQRVRLNTDLHLMPRLPISGAVIPLQHTPSWNAFYFIFQGS
jgi:hypothetical protein